VRPSVGEIEEAVVDAAAGSAEGRTGDVIREAGLDALPVLAGRLGGDSPIEVLERFEAVLKTALLSGLSGGVSGPAARSVARFQRDLGFLCKYKSYAVKCATPLGYSVFLQREREGFSFQRHVTRKTEVFHILSAPPGAYAFVCGYDEWAASYDRDAFAAWLAGRPDARYDRHRFDVRPGDVFAIDQLNVVHTVVGCVLEEFATVSTDMVDRLHDQNQGRPIPADFNRDAARHRLEELVFPPAARLLDLDGPATRATPVDPEPMRGGRLLRLADSFVVATRYLVEPGGTTDVRHDDARAAMVHVTAGSGRVVIADEDEAARPDPPFLAVRKPDVLLVAPGMRCAFVNEGEGPFELSEHRITLEAALA
jgi:mannose-6-phosphate isomerase-like protein (cupin superfamily)